MLPVVWRHAAEMSLEEITDYVTGWNPVAALDMEMQITATALSLGQFPYIGRVGRVAGTRELLVHPNYWLIYRVAAAQVDILNVLHVRREYP
jgi:plasmid stabilization system protein ParE